MRRIIRIWHTLTSFEDKKDKKDKKDKFLFIKTLITLIITNL